MSGINVVSRLGGDYDNFTEKERLVKLYILKNLNSISKLSIEDLSKAAGTSNTTISRFCRKLGFSGYRDFIIELAKETTSSYARLNADVTETDSAFDVADKMFNTECSALEKTYKMLRNSNLDEVIRLILQKKRVAVFGSGGSYSIATDLYHKLCRLGFKCTLQADIVFQKVLANQISDDSIAWIVSLSGYDAEMLNIAHMVKANGAPLICMVNDYNSPLAQLATYTFYGAYLDNFAYTGTTESRLSLMYIIDVIYTLLSIKGAPETIQKLEETRVILTGRLTGAIREKE